jgi:hypothetical protein
VKSSASRRNVKAQAPVLLPENRARLTRHPPPRPGAYWADHEALMKWRINSQGYLESWKKHSCILQHRLIWEIYRGSIPRGHAIHHKNEIRTDNRIENLECMPLSEHARLHSVIGNSGLHLIRYQETAPILERTCKKCSKQFETQHPNHKFCSKECQEQFHNALHSAKRSAKRAEAHVAVSCAHCGTSFGVTRKGRIYCSKACLSTAATQRWRKRQAA